MAVLEALLLLLSTNSSRSTVRIDAYKAFGRSCLTLIACVKVSPIPGKGRGLVATVNIRKGTCIFTEEPLLRVALSEIAGKLPPDCNPLVSEVKASHRLKASQMERLEVATFEHVYASLSLQKQKVLAMMHAVDLHGRGITEAERPFAAYIANRHGDDPNRPFDSVLFARTALANHDCTPNAATAYQAGSNCKCLLYATRNITAGDEITISYISLTTSRAQRQAALKPWYFKCTCRSCSGSQAEIAKDDELRHLIAAFENDFTMTAIDKVRMSCRIVLQVFTGSDSG